MTIIFHGHIENVANGATPGGARLTIQPEARRDLQNLVLEAFKGEADAYRPGQAVEVRIIPVSVDKAYITPYEAVFIQIAEAIGLKGEIWNAHTVVDRVKDMKRRLDALRDAVG